MAFWVQIVLWNIRDRSSKLNIQIIVIQDQWFHNFCQDFYISPVGFWDQGTCLSNLVNRTEEYCEYLNLILLKYSPIVLELVLWKQRNAAPNMWRRNVLYSCLWCFKNALSSVLLLLCFHLGQVFLVPAFQNNPGDLGMNVNWSVVCHIFIAEHNSNSKY